MSPYSRYQRVTLYMLCRCGPPPYYGSKSAPNATRHCALINDNEEYHYNDAGWAILAAAVADEFKKLLTVKPSAQTSSQTKPQRPVNNTMSNTATSPVLTTNAAVAMCPDGLTGCPAGTTCIPDSFSNTKWGCCLLPNAVGCDDNWHCCPAQTQCRGNGTNPVSPGHPAAANYSHVCIPTGGV